jgi:hypothetical protein
LKKQSRQSKNKAKGGSKAQNPANKENEAGLVNEIVVNEIVVNKTVVFEFVEDDVVVDKIVVSKPENQFLTIKENQNGY